MGCSPPEQAPAFFHLFLGASQKIWLVTGAVVLLADAAVLGFGLTLFDGVDPSVLLSFLVLSHSSVVLLGFVVHQARATGVMSHFVYNLCESIERCISEGRHEYDEAEAAMKLSANGSSAGSDPQEESEHSGKSSSTNYIETDACGFDRRCNVDWSEIAFAVPPCKCKIYPSRANKMLQNLKCRMVSSVSWTSLYLKGFFENAFGPLPLCGKSLTAPAEAEESAEPRPYLFQQTAESESMRVLSQKLCIYREALQRYVPQPAIDEIEAQMTESQASVSLEPHAHQCKAAVMFLDIKDFTRRSESMALSPLLKILGEFYSVITHCTQSHRGVVCAFLGDGAMCLWEVANSDMAHMAPKGCYAMTSADAVGGALAAALDIVASLSSHPLPEVSSLDVRVGIHYGPCNVGIFGSGERLCFTALSDTVNTASRVEAATRLFSSKILVSRSVADVIHTSASLSHAVLLVKAGAVAAKGKAEDLEVFEAVRRSPEQLYVMSCITAAQGCFDERNYIGGMEAARTGLAADPANEALSKLMDDCISGIQFSYA